MGWMNGYWLEINLKTSMTLFTYCTMLSFDKVIKGIWR